MARPFAVLQKALKFEVLHLLSTVLSSKYLVCNRVSSVIFIYNSFNDTRFVTIIHRLSYTTESLISSN